MLPELFNKSEKDTKEGYHMHQRISRSGYQADVLQHIHICHTFATYPYLDAAYLLISLAVEEDGGGNVLDARGWMLDTGC